MLTTTPEAEILVGIAALGLTVTGFSGLISVLDRRAKGEWSAAQRFQLGQLIELSLAVTFGAFIPLLVDMLLQDMALRVAVGLVALSHLLVLLRGVAKNFKHGSLAAVLPTGMTVFMVLGGLVLIVAAAISWAGWIGGAAFLVIANLLWQLMVAIVHFIYLLMSPGTTD